MTRQITVVADDYGITRSASDTILDASRSGTLNGVSILANGLAFDYAVERLTEYPDLGVSVHINLTEGKALSDPKDIPHLVLADGTFRHSSIRLLLLTLFSSSSYRAELRIEVEREMRSQVERVRSRVPRPLSIDGHQHVHMVPLVFSVLASLHIENQFSRVRLPKEPFFISPRSPFAYVTGKIVRHIGLNMLSWKNRSLAIRSGMKVPDFFIGTLLSGQLTPHAVRSALEEVDRRHGDSVEIGVHPGRSMLEELEGWKGDTKWYTSHWRDCETTLLADPSFRSVIESFKSERLFGGSLVLKLFRFGIVGLLSAAVSLGVLYVLTDFGGVLYLFSAVIAYVLGIGVSYTLQKFWTFSHRSLEHTKREILLYVLNTLFCIFLNVLGLFIFVEYLHMWYMVAEVLVIALISIWSFLVYRFLIFRT